MAFLKVFSLFSIILLLNSFSLSVQSLNLNPLDLSVRKTPRINIPLFSGLHCNGCPLHSCENDPAIIYGYCCGCAKFLDRLPVLCPKGLDCPLNGAPLCHDYEYMMICCC